MSTGLTNTGLILYNCALGAIFGVGLLGNCLVIGVICRQRGSRSVTSVYLANLAVADALHLFSVPPLIHTATAGYWPWNHLACKVYYMLYYTNFTMSVYIITAMSFDRYKAVVSPFTSAKFRNKTFATVILVAMWIAGAVVISPIYLFAHKTQYNNTGPQYCTHTANPLDLDLEFDNETLPEAPLQPGETFYSRLRSFFTNPAYFARYMFITGCVLPGILLVLFYSLIVHKLYRMKLARNSSGQAQERFEKVTLLVGAVVAFYIVCCLPHWIHVNVSLSTQGAIGIDGAYWLTMSSHMTALLGYVSSAGNPVLYAFLNEPFRASLREILGIGQAGGASAGNRAPQAGGGTAAGAAAARTAATGGAAGGATTSAGVCGFDGGTAELPLLRCSSPTVGLTTFNVTSQRHHCDDEEDGYLMDAASGGTKETAVI